MTTVYRDAQQAGQQAARMVQRTAILDASIRLLVTEGISALTMRRIAAEVGASTKVLYTMFGGKGGLAEALYREGFARFGRALEKVPREAEPLAYLGAVAAAYRAYAVAEPDYYRMMFERPIPGFTPSPGAVASARQTFDIGIGAVAACIEAGQLRPGEPREIFEVLWAAAHGAVSLELAGHFDVREAPGRYDVLVTAALKAFTV